MARKTEEWIGRDADSRVPARVLERLWERSGGRCQGCGLNLIGQVWNADHVIELKLGGQNRESNLQILGAKCCHKAKTRAAMIEIHRTSRKVRALSGIKRMATRNPLPGGKRTRLQKKLDGTVIDRITGKVISRKRG